MQEPDQPRKNTPEDKPWDKLTSNITEFKNSPDYQNLKDQGRKEAGQLKSNLDLNRKTFLGSKVFFGLMALMLVSIIFLPWTVRLSSTTYQSCMFTNLGSCYGTDVGMNINHFVFGGATGLGVLAGWLALFGVILLLIWKLYDAEKITTSWFRYAPWVAVGLWGLAVFLSLGQILSLPELFLMSNDGYSTVGLPWGLLLFIAAAVGLYLYYRKSGEARSISQLKQDLRQLKEKISKQ